ncbi:heparanase-like protein 2 [Glycine max]|uniref:heparanase-like protein 2 n=1 Tax=Glycine max TaxID=3847 RepID=UPI001B3566A5|nr:heparanase-like protein 2 [Glycine max]
MLNVIKHLIFLDVKNHKPEDLISQGSILGVEVSISRKSYSTQLVVMEDENGNQNSAPPQNGGFLIPNIFTLTIPKVDGGNELSGKGIGASVGVAQYGKDLIKLKQILSTLYESSKFKPSLVEPGGFYEKYWYERLLQVSGSGIINVLTHHLYNLGQYIIYSFQYLTLSAYLVPRVIYFVHLLEKYYCLSFLISVSKLISLSDSDEHLERKILDPERLSRVESIFSNLSETIKIYGPWSSAWVGEAGGAYNSGGNHVSNRFLNNFWYLDQLGIASCYSTKVYSRQTLIGGNYGLLNTTTFAPNPDYYSAVLWHRLMGKKILAVSSDVHIKDFYIQLENVSKS